MYRNLNAEIIRCGLSAKQIAKSLSISEQTMTNKLSGKFLFKSSEMYKIQNLYFPEIQVEYLFSYNGDENGND
jgi:DNA-binding XRE family transcriptional regulator